MPSEAENAELRQRIDRAAQTLEHIRAVSTNAREQEALAECQNRHDQVARLFNDRAPAPLAGEDHDDYRRRATIATAKLVGKYADMTPRQIPHPLVAQIETQILAEAREAAQRRDAARPGLTPHTTRNEYGQVVTEFYGAGNPWAPFSSAGASGSFNVNPPPKGN